MKDSINRYFANYFNSPKSLFFLLSCIGICLSFCSCGLQNGANNPTWDDFCAAMEDSYGEEPGTLTANYVDRDGWCYFLAEDSRQIYRFSEESPQWELIVEDAWGCMTVMDKGVLFLRGRGIYIGTLYWGNEYDLILWQDGIETLLWENTDIIPRDGCMLAVGNFLIYDGYGDLSVRPLLLDGENPKVGDSVGEITDCTATQRLLWCDGTTLWYGVRDETSAIDTIRAMELETKTNADSVTSGWKATGWDARYPWSIAVSDNQLYYVQDDRIYVQDLTQMRVQEVCAIPENTEAYAYGTSTGEALVLWQDYSQGWHITQDISAGWTLETSERITVQTVLGNIAIVKIREYIDGYDYCVRTALYELDTNKRIWQSNGDVYVEVA